MNNVSTVLSLIDKIDTFNSIFDVLVKEAGAPEQLRDDFVYHHARCEDRCDEFRFVGSLGWGGKYRSGTNSVSCYSEDETPSRRLVIEKTNAALSEVTTPPNKFGGL